MDKNLDTYNQYVHEYIDYSTGVSEREIIYSLRDRWSDTRMLDIGIGTGRSTYTFSAITKEYVGIDYAEEMIRQCRAVLPERGSIRYELCDARDLSRYYDNPFDFVLFSLNGLDSVDHDDRAAILEEVLNVLKPDGIFCFSSHSINNFSIRRELPAFRITRPIKSAYYLLRAMLFNARLMREFRGQDQTEIRARNWAVLKTGDHDFNIDIYHINPAYQVDELNRLGYEIVRVLDRSGSTVDPKIVEDDWLYYMCKRSPDGPA